MEITATKRDVTGKAVKKLREAGKMPAVFYSAKDESTPIEVSTKDFEKVFKEAGESTVITLDVDSDKKSVLIHDVDVDPVSGDLRHADFYVIQKGQKVEVDVPITFVGESSAVKEKNANLVKVLHDLQIEAEATNLPHEIEIDISVLKEVGDQITAGQLTLPEGVELITGAEEVIALTEEQKEEEPEEETPTEIDMDAIGDAEERGKKDEGDGDTESESSTENKDEKPAE